MKSPWVSRAHLEAVERELAQWKAAYERERDRYEDLARKTFRLPAVTPVMSDVPRGTYACPPDCLETSPHTHHSGLGVLRAAVTRSVASVPDPLTSLIDEMCGTNLRKRAMMLRQLSADRAAKIPDEQIEESIRNGLQVDGVPS